MVAVAVGRSHDSVDRVRRRFGRVTSTVSREVHATGGKDRYRDWDAQRRAHEQARRPKVPKLACARLRRVVERMLKRKYSPQQIARRLKLEYPHDPEMWVSHETI